MNTQKNQKGFTLIELIVVVAIIGIIGAALVPQFATMSLRSRMSTDVSTIKTAQNQVEIYYQDMGSWPGAAANTYADVMKSLINDNYLDSKYLSNSSLLMQTDGASVGWDQTDHKLYVSVKAADLEKYNKKTDIDQSWIRSN